MAQQSPEKTGQPPEKTGTSPERTGGRSDPSDPQSTTGVGRQSGQQREHGHMSREDQQRDKAQPESGTDRLTGHPDASRESVQRGSTGGTGEDTSAEQGRS